MNRIRHISTTTVRPTSLELTDHRIELTPWDLRLIELDYIQKGLLFRKSSTEKEINQSFIQHLKATLSHTLNIFYPLAGRLALIKNEHTITCSSFFVDCNGAGAQFVHAAANGVTVADILDPVYIPDDIVSNLFPMNGVLNYQGVSKPLLAVQVTELVDGTFIGCTMNHSVADGSSFWHFFNTWSEISRSGSDEISLPAPVFSRHFLDGLIDLPIQIPFSHHEIMANKLTLPMSPNSLQRVFHFSKQKIAELKSKANAEMGTNNISSLQALMAHLWRAVTRCTHHPNPDQAVTYWVVVGLRQRLESLLTEQYLGNAFLGVPVNSTAGELLQHGLGSAALHIRKTIYSLTSEEVKKFLQDWVKSPKISSSLRDIPTNITSTSAVSLLTGSSPRFNVYGNDFGRGRPVAVRSGAANKRNGKLTVFPGAEEGSIDFEVCLLPETLHAMAEDAEFMEAVLT